MAYPPAFLTLDLMSTNFLAGVSMVLIVPFLNFFFKSGNNLIVLIVTGKQQRVLEKVKSLKRREINEEMKSMK